MATEKRLIDVNALIEEINQQRRSSRTSFPRRSYVVGDVLTSIYNAPTVDAVEVVHGRWIADEDGLDEDGNGQYRCSHCGVGEKHNPTVTVSYCWNCGAKMDLEVSDGQA